MITHTIGAHTTEHYEIYTAQHYLIVTKTLSNNPLNTASSNRQTAILL